MCSIGGAIVAVDMLKHRHEIFDLFGQQIMRHFRNGSDRGRDAWGVFTINDLGHTVSEIAPGSSATSWIPRNIETVIERGVRSAINSRPLRHVIYHCRAIPVTEKRSWEKYLSQPVRGSGWVVAHNGLIANDKELIEKYELKIDTSKDYFDSMILPEIFAKLRTPKRIAQFLREELKGSFAIAAVSTLWYYKRFVWELMDF